MDWEQKLQALNALAECSLMMRAPGDWYVSQQLDIKDRCVLKSVCGSGETPADAVDAHWHQCTADLADHEYLVARTFWDGLVSKRLAVRWNGFMWNHVEEKPAVAA